MSESGGGAIANPANDRYVSLVSIWEIAIKRSIAKLPVTEAMLDQALTNLAIEELPLRRSHIRLMSELPSHHHDPFDRLLIAQAKAEG